MKKLFVMCGPSGAGKTTWVKNCEKVIDMKYAYISRDAIRFSMLKDGEDYFSHEDDVFKKFYSDINDALNDDDILVVFADATHLNVRSRNKLMDKLEINPDIMIYMVDFDVTVKLCIAQNNLRKGTRGYVPETALIRMWNAYSAPTENENKNYTYHIIHVQRRL